MSGLLQDLGSLVPAFNSSALDSVNGSSWLPVLGSSLCGGNRTFFSSGGAGQDNSQNSKATEMDDLKRNYENKKKYYESKGICKLKEYIVPYSKFQFPIIH